MNILVTVDKNWAIGNQGQLLVSIPEDQRLLGGDFRGIVVMGRKTFETLPGKQPRCIPEVNVILSKDRNYQVKGAVVCHSVDETFEFLKQYPPGLRIHHHWRERVSTTSSCLTVIRSM